MADLVATPRGTRASHGYHRLMRTTVIIPTLEGNRPVLHDAIRALAEQARRPERVVVSADGFTAPAPDLSPLIGAGVEALCVRGPRGGPAAARNRALEHAEGDLVLFLNDDVVPASALLAEHVAFHSSKRGEGAVAVGHAEWSFGREPIRVIDRLVAETSMIFFYDRMVDSPDRDWGFRHAWTLNLSLPRALCRPFDERFRYPMFEDVEWAHRCAQGNAEVRYLPDARVEHRHRPQYTPEALLRREVLIGHQAWMLRAVSPGAFADVFGATPPSIVVESKEQPRPLAARTFEAFVRISNKPGAGTDISAVFEACRAWRIAARAIGWGAAEAGNSAEKAIQEAHNTISAFAGSS